MTEALFPTGPDNDEVEMERVVDADEGVILDDLPGPVVHGALEIIRDRAPGNPGRERGRRGDEEKKACEECARAS
jgi:hypothetical protein